MLQRNYPYHTYRPLGRLGCWLPLLILLILLIGGGWLAYQDVEATLAFLALLEQFFASSTFTALSIVGLALSVITIILANIFKRTTLGKLLSRLVSIMFIAALITFIFWVTHLNPHIGITRAGFTTSSVDIVTDNKITFQNPSNGVTQTLCVGTNQICEPANTTGNPAPLVRGLTILPGQSVNVTFDTGGTYHITSKNTPNMNLKIVVVDFTSDSGGD